MKTTKTYLTLTNLFPNKQMYDPTVIDCYVPAALIPACCELKRSDLSTALENSRYGWVVQTTEKLNTNGNRVLSAKFAGRKGMRHSVRQPYDKGLDVQQNHLSVALKFLNNLVVSEKYKLAGIFSTAEGFIFSFN